MKKQRIFLTIVIFLSAFLIATKYFGIKVSTKQRELSNLLATIKIHEGATERTISSEIPGQIVTNMLLKDSEITSVKKWHLENLQKEGWKITLDSQTNGDQHLEAEKDGKTLVLSITQENESEPISVTIEILEPTIVSKYIRNPVVNNYTENPEKIH